MSQPHTLFSDATIDPFLLSDSDQSYSQSDYEELFPPDGESPLSSLTDNGIFDGLDFALDDSSTPPTGSSRSSSTSPGDFSDFKFDHKNISTEAFNNNSNNIPVYPVSPCSHAPDPYPFLSQRQQQILQQPSLLYQHSIPPTPLIRQTPHNNISNPQRPLHVRSYTHNQQPSFHRQDQYDFTPVPIHQPQPRRRSLSHGDAQRLAEHMTPTFFRLQMTRDRSPVPARSRSGRGPPKRPRATPYQQQPQQQHTSYPRYISPHSGPDERSREEAQIPSLGGAVDAKNASLQNVYHPPPPHHQSTNTTIHTPALTTTPSFPATNNYNSPSHHHSAAKTCRESTNELHELHTASPPSHCSIPLQITGSSHTSSPPHRNPAQQDIKKQENGEKEEMPPFLMTHMPRAEQVGKSPRIIEIGAMAVVNRRHHHHHHIPQLHQDPQLGINSPPTIPVSRDDEAREARYASSSTYREPPGNAQNMPANTVRNTPSPITKSAGTATRELELARLRIVELEKLLELDIDGTEKKPALVHSDDNNNNNNDSLLRLAVPTSTISPTNLETAGHKENAGGSISPLPLPSSSSSQTPVPDIAGDEYNDISIDIPMTTTTMSYKDPPPRKQSVLEAPSRSMISSGFDDDEDGFGGLFGGE
ncbi:unnamed protein product [Periconia digitata]|uniref:Uncharacterized protein n=1 Tax=Periconia digitata TaxID=1303443 RepID=A0A9W4UB30_9PLEO|nr:unnamed protein product [Periconia digitata]